MWRTSFVLGYLKLSCGSGQVGSLRQQGETGNLPLTKVHGPKESRLLYKHTRDRFPRRSEVGV